MKDKRQIISITFALAAIVSLSACGAQPPLPGTNAGANTQVNTNMNTNRTEVATSTPSPIEVKEPDNYTAKVTLKFEAVGDSKATVLPTLTARVARSGNDRRMEFTMPAGGRVVYLDKAGTNYLVLPDKKQYAELDRESLGFDVRRMLMPEQIVDQVKAVPGVKLVGEEKYEGRDALKYSYQANADTQTKAGDVETDSFIFVDKETGLPLHAEVISQSQSGSNVQGYNGLKVITNITDIQKDPAVNLFDAPTEFQKIESDQIRSQVDMIFNSIAGFLSQALKYSQTTSSSPAR